MKLRDLPDDILTKNIFNTLDNASLCAVGHTSCFFSSAAYKAITKRKLEYLLNYDSNELSLEKIEDYVDFLAKESGLVTGAKCLIHAIQNAQYQFQVDRVGYLKEFYVKKFGLFGQIFKLIYTIEYDNNKTRYALALELLYLIKLIFSKECSPDILKGLNDFNKDIFVGYKDADCKNDHLFLGKTESLITFDPITMEIQMCGTPIDDVINYISQQKLPVEITFNEVLDISRLLDFTGDDDDDELMMTDTNTLDFKEYVNIKITEAESNAHRTMEEINKNTPESGHSFKM